jgi:hypothetical protein
MIRVDNPLVVFVGLVAFVAGLVVYPFVKTERFRVTPSKAVALLVAIAVCVYNGTLAFIVVLLWPLSFIWFPEYWGSYTGFIRGPYIDEKSPPTLVSLMGWSFLVIFPLLFLWITSR